MLCRAAGYGVRIRNQASGEVGRIGADVERHCPAADEIRYSDGVSERIVAAANAAVRRAEITAASSSTSGTPVRTEFSTITPLTRGWPSATLPGTEEIHLTPGCAPPPKPEKHGVGQRCPSPLVLYVRLTDGRQRLHAKRPSPEPQRCERRA